jgi:hypothetical protein
MQFVTLAFKEFVTAHNDFDIKIACRPPVGTSLALTLQLNSGPGVNTRWNLDREISTVTDPTLTRALNTWMRDGGSMTLASGARARRHYLTQETLLNGLQFAVALAHDAGDRLRPRSHTGSGALFTGNRSVYGNLFLLAEDGRG